MFTILVSCINSIKKKMILTLLLHESIIENKIDTMFKECVGNRQIKTRSIKLYHLYNNCIRGRFHILGEARGALS